MERTEIRKIAEDSGSVVGTGRRLRVDGWVRTVRGSKNVAFMEINDGSCFQNLQAVLSQDTLPNYSEAAKLASG